MAASTSKHSQGNILQQHGDHHAAQQEQGGDKVHHPDAYKPFGFGDVAGGTTH